MCACVFSTVIDFWTWQAVASLFFFFLDIPSKPVHWGKQLPLPVLFNLQVQETVRLLLHIHTDKQKHPHNHNRWRKAAHGDLHRGHLSFYTVSKVVSNNGKRTWKEINGGRRRAFSSPERDCDRFSGLHHSCRHLKTPHGPIYPLVYTLLKINERVFHSMLGKRWLMSHWPVHWQIDQKENDPNLKSYISFQGFVRVWETTLNESLSVSVSHTSVTSCVS